MFIPKTEIKSLFFSGIFLLRKLCRKKSLLQKKNLIQAVYSLIKGEIKVGHYPVRLTIDPCNYCNLSCQLCPVGCREGGRQQGLMNWHLFQKIIDECGPYLWEINLYNWGEPLLNPDLFKMINYASFNYGIDVTISSNLLLLGSEGVEKFLNSGLRKLIVSLDGVSDEAVGSYQKGNKPQVVIENLKNLISEKRRLGLKYPLVEWRYIVNRYNENEISLARRLSLELGLDKIEFLPIRCRMSQELFLSPQEQFQNVSDWLPNEDLFSMYDKNLKSKKKIISPPCSQLWWESVIHPNGSISPCCAVWQEKFDFGSLVSSGSFFNIWNNAKYQQARKLQFLKSPEGPGENICQICLSNQALI